MVLCSHTAALRSRYEEQLKSLFHKAIDSLTATIGTGRALASLALVTMSGLTFNDRRVSAPPCQMCRFITLLLVHAAAVWMVKDADQS